MPYLFDTDAISEVLKRRPLADFLSWLSSLPRAEQFTSAVVSHAFGVTLPPWGTPCGNILPKNLGAIKVYGQTRQHSY